MFKFNKSSRLRQGSGGQAKRKEINLSELRQALEQSLAKKDQVSPEEELKQRIEEEKELDKAQDELEKTPKKPQENKADVPDDKKNILKPGEAVKL